MSRHDAVLIRVSTDGQDHEGQIKNVTNVLGARGVAVPPHHWHTYTTSRGKVEASAEFKRFIKRVEADEVGTAYVESRDRFGGTDALRACHALSAARTRFAAGRACQGRPTPAT